VHKKEKIETIRHQGNVGQKFIEFFEKRKVQDTTNLDNNYSELSKEGKNTDYNDKYKFETKSTTEKIEYFEDDKQNSVKNILLSQNIKSGESSQNSLYQERNKKNNFQANDRNNNQDINNNMIVFYSSSNFSSNLKKNKKYLMQRVKERLERIIRL